MLATRPLLACVCVFLGEGDEEQEVKMGAYGPADALALHSIHDSLI